MRIFTEHPSSIGESYWEHMRCATRVTFRMRLLGLAVFIHAFLPFLFTNTMSQGLYRLVDEMELREQRRR
jgi:hypothetical protein